MLFPRLAELPIARLVGSAGRNAGKWVEFKLKTFTYLFSASLPARSVGLTLRSLILTILSSDAD
jgi:hypothetical protein